MTVWFALSGREDLAGRGPWALPTATMAGALRAGPDLQESEMHHAEPPLLWELLLWGLALAPAPA